jgi:hypothetical protein
MAPKFDSGILFDVGIKPSRQLFRTCLALPVLRMLKGQTIGNFLVPLISEILIDSEWLTIGRWISLPHSLVFCIPLE